MYKPYNIKRRYMSTRSIVGRYTMTDPTNPKAWEGVYVHWDGYPSHMGEALATIVARDGYQLAGDTILGGSWSAIDAQRTENEWEELRGKNQFVIVDGYGIRYQDETAPFIYTHDNLDALSDSWAEYVYIINAENVVEFYPISGPSETNNGIDIPGLKVMETEIPVSSPLQLN